MDTRPWVLYEAIELARELGTFSRVFGGNVALAGGCLHYDGERKDCDLVVFPDTRYKFNEEKFWECARSIGVIRILERRPWGWHANYKDRTLDITILDYQQSPELEDEKFAVEYTDARGKLDYEWMARVLSGRLRQMDKRAKAANQTVTDQRELIKELKKWLPDASSNM